uniref:Tetratricopeptide repeat protein n=1 Tax=Panagrolaimus superbus TaxID=310955 RepID=A0A914Y803_9BILA
MSIGLQFYSIKCYNDALKYFLRSEHIKAGISASNLYHIGDCLKRNGQIDESIEYFKKAITVPVRNRFDYKGYSESRKMLASVGYTEEELNRISPKKV